MMDGIEFANNVSRWCHDRNLVEGSSPDRQCKKLLEELTELYAGTMDRDLVEIKDGIGDCEVVLRVIETQIGLPYVEPNYSPVIGHIHGSRSRIYVHQEINEARLTLWIIAKDYGLTIGECRAHAWNEIKDRKGRMVNGIFVKEADLVMAGAFPETD
jgi:hypothetical protein